MAAFLESRTLSLSLTTLAILAAGLTCRAAHADAPDAGNTMRLPVPESERPITLPSLVASPVVGFRFERYPGDLTYADLDLSGRFGITDDLNVHALVAPLQLSAPPGRGASSMARPSATRARVSARRTGSYGGPWRSAPT